MRRRKFIALSAGAAASWSLASCAQQATAMRRVAFLHPYLENDNEVLIRVVAFRKGLEALGWIENRNIRIEHRYSGGDPGRIRAYATELVQSAPDVIVGSGTPITAALKEATSTIPIVFNLVNDPVGQGFVASLSRPGGNITGFTFIDFLMIGKWMEMIEEIAPGVRRVALIFNPDTTPFYPAFLQELEAARTSLALELSASPVHDEAEVEAAITALAREPGGGLIAAPDAFINNHRRAVITLTERHRLPAIYGFRQFVAEGALISYGPNTADIVRRSAGYVDRVLKGERPADLPVQAPTKYELVINLKTAKALGIAPAPGLLARADGVIQ
ncbi:ABC transporter substrate-binding protein [Bradyrhizobium sp. Cp5.3]|uniref:ABC transporter substrate-binding protein n=1 Tax=Bradyrhizobium sp. Cp5.3 TaxID=443598 RepID=UPI0003FE294C|nr:ABC transporter substrate-binding protein [Bradyrhizobium sp. Cp5.3]